MAEEEIEVEEPTAEKRKPPLKWILLGVIILAVLGGGLAGYLFLTPSSDEADQPKEAFRMATRPPITARKDFPRIFPLDSFVVNLNEPGGKRYLKTTIELESAGDDFSGALNAKLAQVKDAVLMVLSSKSLADVQRIEGKLSLRKELIVQINKVMKPKRIRNLYFTEFVIQ